jgi:hypothetical protein
MGWTHLLLFHVIIIIIIISSSNTLFLFRAAIGCDKASLMFVDYRPVPAELLFFTHDAKDGLVRMPVDKVSRVGRPDPR